MKKPPVSVPDSEADSVGDVMLLPEAPAFLICHSETVKKEAAKANIPHFRVGTGWRFSRVALTRYVQQSKGPGKGGPDQAA